MHVEWPANACAIIILLGNLKITHLKALNKMKEIKDLVPKPEPILFFFSYHLFLIIKVHICQNFEQYTKKVKIPITPTPKR